MKARTRLARIEGMMRHDDRPWIPPLELPHQREQRTLLRLRPRVRRPALGIQTTLVAHPDAMPVVVQAVRPHLRLGPPPLYGSVPPHYIVVADTTPAPLAVPRVNLLRARCLAGPYRRAMNNDQRDCSHDSLLLMLLFPLRFPLRLRCLYLASMPMIAPAKVRISPKAVNTLGSMTPVGGTINDAASNASPKNRSSTQTTAWY